MGADQETGRETSKEMTPQEMAAVLRRIVQAVESDQRNHWMEITCAVMLAFASMGSAWCAYQSTLWGGVQTFRLVAASKAGRESSQQALTAVQFRAVDAQMATAYFQAKGQGNEKLAEFLRERFRPDAKAAFDAWLNTDPFNNREAPKNPFVMKEYEQPQEREATRLEEESGKLFDSAQQANVTSDTYVLMTVLFASVLFFGGISGTFQSRGLRRATVSIATILFLATVCAMATMPICRE
jgi:hypothetical protein